MCTSSKFVEKPTTAYKKSVRKDYGEVVSIDVSFKLIKEFLEARQLVECGPMPFTEDGEANKANREMYEKRVRPFFDHMSEIIDSL